MKYKKLYNPDELFDSDGAVKEELLDEIISAAYGDAGYFHRKRIDKLAAIYPKIKNVFEEYKNTAKSVHSIENEDIPEDLLKKVEHRIGEISDNERSFMFEVYTIFHTKPLITGMATVSLIVLLVFAVFVEREPVAPIYSKADVELADQQAKEVLALVGSIFNKTTNSLKKEILKKRVSNPINKSMDKINDLFREGGPNENVN